MAQQGVIIAVDPYVRSLGGLKRYGWLRSIAHAEVAKSSNGRVIWVEDLGKNAAAHPSVQPYLTVDFVFIDADHSWDGIAGDWNAWNRQIAIGGIVALHDSANCDFDSARFTKEVIIPDRCFQHLDTVDTLTVFQKLA